MLYHKIQSLYMRDPATGHKALQDESVHNTVLHAMINESRQIVEDFRKRLESMWAITPEERAKVSK